MSSKTPNFIWTTPSIHPMVVGEALVQSLEFDGTGELASADTKSYRSGQDVSSTCVSGSATITGRVLTTKTFTPDQKGTYIVVQELTDGGIARRIKTKILVARAEDGG